MSNPTPPSRNAAYRGRIAPTPTGLLHLGHAATFWQAFEHARSRGGHLILRIEDLDPKRCSAEFSQAALRDLAWLGIHWDEGPVFQSGRREHYLAAWQALRDGGWIYPCARSRKDVAGAAFAPHEEEPIFPPEWRMPCEEALKWSEPGGINWRFRVPDGETLSFQDENLGAISRTAHRDFGDFIIWNREDIPAYELAVVVDDSAMGITEVVRGADLLTSTARQLLLYRALGTMPPRFCHTALVVDEAGRRLAKRNAALSVQALREAGMKPEEMIEIAAERSALPSLLQ